MTKETEKAREEFLLGFQKMLGGGGKKKPCIFSTSFWTDDDRYRDDDMDLYTIHPQPSRSKTNAASQAVVTEKLDSESTRFKP